jgi:hypothetical protein
VECKGTLDGRPEQVFKLLINYLWRYMKVYIVIYEDWNGFLVERAFFAKAAADKYVASYHPDWADHLTVYEIEVHNA